MSELPPIRFVYAIEALSLGLIKIGVATDPLARLAALKTASPDELVLRGVILSDRPYEAEREIHQMLGDTRVRGEWFSRSPDLDLILDRLPTFEQFRSEGIVWFMRMHTGLRAWASAIRLPDDDDQTYYRRALEVYQGGKVWTITRYVW